MPSPGNLKPVRITELPFREKFVIACQDLPSYFQAFILSKALSLTLKRKAVKLLIKITQLLVKIVLNEFILS